MASQEFFNSLRSGTLLTPFDNSQPGLTQMAIQIEAIFEKNFPHIFWNIKNRQECFDDAAYLTIAIKRIKESSSREGLRLLNACVEEWERKYAD